MVLDRDLEAMPWTERAAHRQWLLREADDLFRFFEAASLDPDGGVRVPDTDGRPLPGGVTELHTTTRLVHCFALGSLQGRPGARAILDHGMRALWERHRDKEQGGYVWSFGPGGFVDDRKQAYGHAFVLLAASSALQAGHPDAARLLTDVTDILDKRFWEEAHGASAEEFTRDWQPFDTYRGQNSNMHLTEALMAAFEATGERAYLDKAGRIADLVVNRHARAQGWRLPEHFTEDWQVDRAYDGNPIFRPYGTTPGHWLEWARLLVQLWELEGRRSDWMLEAARALFAQSLADGWDAARGGFVYTLDWDGAPRIGDRYWWPACEGIAAAAALRAVTGESLYEDWYRRIWDFAALHLIDRRHGGWHPQLGPDNQPKSEPFADKPDLYHALQACLIPLLPTDIGLAKGLREGRLATA
ncbi:AGE family epimerase/isomerase [Aureimonas ureilytica]|uniref:AGE family epimerase/isomerase n=1 Tax=Aureimonas ureilytica TaxID=401562 RepID=UPI003CF1114B